MHRSENSSSIQKFRFTAMTNKKKTVLYKYFNNAIFVNSKQANNSLMFQLPKHCFTLFNVFQEFAPHHVSKNVFVEV